MSSDASATEGRRFIVGRRRSGGLFGLFDSPPRVVGESLTAAHIRARKPWPAGEEGVQVEWSHHGRVRVLQLDSGVQVGCWTDETWPVEANRAPAMSTSAETRSE